MGMQKRRILALILFGVCLAGCFSGGDGPTTAVNGEVKAREATLPFMQLGSGKDVLVLPDGPGWEYRYLLKPLEPLAKTLRLTFFEARYLGLAQHDLNPRFLTPAQLVEDVEAVRAQAIDSKIHLLAHGWGCQLALHYAEKYPENIKSLILINPIPVFQRQRAWHSFFQTVELRRTEQDAAVLKELIGSEEWEARRASTVEQVLRGSLRALVYDPGVVEKMDLGVTEATAQAFPLYQGLLDPQADRTSWESLLPKIRQPVFVVAGSADPIPSWCAVELARQLNEGVYVELEDCGHFIPHEAPELFLAEVSKWFDHLAVEGA